MEQADKFVVEHPTAIIAAIGMMIVCIILLYFEILPTWYRGESMSKKKKRRPAKTADDDSESELDDLVDSITSKQKAA